MFEGTFVQIDILAHKQLNTAACKAPAVVECWMEWIHPISSKLTSKLVGLIELGDDGVNNSPIKDVMTDAPIGSLNMGIYRATSDAEVVKGLYAMQSECEMEDGRLIRESQQLLSSSEVQKSEQRPPDASDNVVDVSAKLRESIISLDSLPGSHENIPSIFQPEIIRTSLVKDAIRFPAVHVLDIGISNAFTSRNDSVSPTGVHVKYNLETSTLISDNHSQSLWWDSECKILNGRAEHRFHIENAEDLSSLTEKGLIMSVEHENDLSSHLKVGSVYIDAATIRSIFTSTSNKSIFLPVITVQGEHVSDLELSFTHHIEPSILRSVENLRISVDSLEQSDASKDDDLASLLVEIEKVINLTFEEARFVYCSCSFLPDEVR